MRRPKGTRASSSKRGEKASAVAGDHRDGRAAEGVMDVPRPRLSLLGLLGIFLIAHLATALWFVLNRSPGTSAALVGFPLDDAWIHMVYARSLAAFQGFAYNPGQLETGATSPLWDIALVPATWFARLFHIGIVVPAKITSLLAAVGTSLAVARLVGRMGLGVAVEVAVGIAIAVDPSLAFAQVSGMEIMLASALATWSLAELVAQRYVAAGIAAGLAPLARPEMVVLTAVVLTVAEWRLHVSRSSFKASVAILLPTVAAVGAWMVYCLAVTGHPLPSTFYVKAATGEEQLSHNVRLIFTEILPASPWYAYGVGAIAWIVGALTLWRRGAVARLFVVFPWLFFLAVAASRPVSSTWGFYFLRYFLPAQAFITATVATGMVVLIRWAWRRRGQQKLSPVLAIGLGLVVVGSLAKLPLALAERASFFAWNCQNIDELNVAMAVWIRDNVPPGEAIAVNDAGASRYFGEHPILDLVGLNHHKLLDGDPHAVDEMARVPYASFFPSLMPALEDNPAWRPIHRTSTQHLTICKTCLQSEIVTYRHVLPER
jgi:hypothetical protein